MIFTREISLLLKLKSGHSDDLHLYVCNNTKHHTTSAPQFQSPVTPPSQCTFMDSITCALVQFIPLPFTTRKT